MLRQVIDFIVEFRGRTAHAAFDPWNARSAADGAEAFVHGVNLLREHVRPSVRMRYTIVKAGDVPNVVADYAKVWMWVRDTKSAGADAVLERVRQIARGACRSLDGPREVLRQSSWRIQRLDASVQAS
jgi:aminobenzoyl-glutamate utilization protein B